MILDGKHFVPDFPEPAKDISIYQAIGILGVLKKPASAEDLMRHCTIADPVVRVWAISTVLLQSRRAQGPMLEAAMQAAHYSAYVRNLLVPILLKGLRFDLINVLQAIDQSAEADLGQLNGRLTQSMIRNDYQSQVLLHEKLYLQTGNVRHVTLARDIAAMWLNWKKALVHFLRVTFTHSEPLQRSTIGLLRMFEAEDARAEFKTIVQVIKPNKDIMLAMVYGAAQLQFWDKNYEHAIRIIEDSGALTMKEARTTPRFCNLIAHCHEKMGHHKHAAEWFQKQNDSVKKDHPKPAQFMTEVNRRAGWNIPALPPDPEDKHVVMTGFTRSGTTLLENVLGAHPDVVTCEESLSFNKALHTAFHLDLAEDPQKQNLALRAAFNRKLYYQELNRYVDKPNPKVIIDKTPMMGANIKYLEKLMPQKRYIFSIRHPYDVVLSNYKQIYNQTIEMVAFNTVYESCVQYDFVMRQWFDVFPAADARVFYVTYDALVTDFERVVRGTLDFLGVDWSDEVSAFAASSSERAVRTPSYAKVRQGLGIGVQTTRRDYEFLFDERCRALLDPWVERHGYGA